MLSCSINNPLTLSGNARTTEVVLAGVRSHAEVGDALAAAHRRAVANLKLKYSISPALNINTFSVGTNTEAAKKTKKSFSRGSLNATSSCLYPIHATYKPYADRHRSTF